MKLSRDRELVIVRAAGVSVWQFLFPAVLSVFLIGILMITVINPLACIMQSSYERMESKFLQGRSSFLAVSSSGLWLRQKSGSYTDDIVPYRKGYVGETIIHAKNLVGEKDLELQDVIIFVYATTDKFSMRIDAKRAKLMADFWNLKNVMITYSDGLSESYDEYFLETELTVKDVHDSFASPETISFWDLPEFINTLQKSGFSALPHRLQWHEILASPLLYVAMVFIAAIFSLRQTRKTRTGLLITSSILCGFLVYFFANLISSLGLSGNIPIVFAAWAPMSVALLTGVGFLLHLEDG